jgi:hypothetical protein
MAIRHLYATLCRIHSCFQSSILMPKGEPLMAKVAPFHSVKNTDRRVYHDNNSCTEGNNIEAANKRAGTDNRPRCEHCARLG